MESRLDATHRRNRPDTLCVHAGTHVDARTGGVCTPVFTSTSYACPNPSGENIYPRYFNAPNQRVIGAKLAALEEGEAGLVFASGTAAISTALFAHLRAGDHAVFQADLYGGTHHFVTAELPRSGIQYSFARTVREIEAAIRPNTKVIYVESPSNPLLRCLDLAAVARLGKTVGALTFADNTFASPVNQNPLALGLDLALHSGTKYLNGHSDVTAGVAVGAQALIDRLIESAANRGGSLDPFACYLLERGLKTLAVRIRRHNENAGALARFLQEHPAVAVAHYPGLPEHPDHAVASRQMRGFGGMLAMELKDPARLDRFLGRLRLPAKALSLGGVETLICVPSRTSHVKMSREDRLAVGIGDALLRISVGIEDFEDLRDDFAQALD